MRTALFLLLLLAVAAVPGSLVPQRTSDPNGVVQYLANNPTLAPILDKAQAFDVYSSVWFSAIYILLFISLVGCVIPRTTHHIRALRSAPPKTPARLERLEEFQVTDAPGVTSVDAITSARAILKKAGYRTITFESARDSSVSAERGYTRETGNLVFHVALIGVLISVGLGGGFSYTGQKVIVEGDSFANVLLSYDSFLPGRFFNNDTLAAYRLKLDHFRVRYEEQNKKALGQPIDYTADVTTYLAGEKKGTDSAIKVNDPLRLGGTDVYLLGNGFAPRITVRDGDGNIAFSQAVPFLPQDSNLTSLGVIKVPDALPVQIGMIGFLYPTAAPLSSGAFTSNYPELLNPVLSLQVYTGDIKLTDGVYSLATDGLTKIAGPKSPNKSIQLTPGQTVGLPGGVGTVTFENETPSAKSDDFSGSVSRFASLDFHQDPSQGWVLFFAMCVLGGLLTSLFIPRRRVWVKAVETDDGIRLEYAGLSRGEDPGLSRAVNEIRDRHSQKLGLG